MQKRTLTERVQILEKKVGELETLPARMTAVESQLVRLRGEMHSGFSAILQRLDAHDGQFVDAQGRFEAIDQRFEAIDQRFDAIDRRFESIDRRFESIDRRFEVIDRRFEAVDRRFDSLERQVREGDEETRQYMRVLHEEVLARLALIQEGRGPTT